MIATTSETQPTRMVQFVESPTETMDVQHRADMSSEAISNRWYTQDELSGMISQNSRACFLLQRSKYLGETSDFCYRGLEHIFLPDYRVRRQKVMRDSFDAVILEQDRQLINNSFNEELIAGTYREAVLYATRIARRRGMRDEEEIQGGPKAKQLDSDSSIPITKKNSRKPGMKVCFDDSVSSNPIPGLQSISAEEKSSCWIRRHEYLGMKVSAINDIHSYMSGQRVAESDDFTIRGLESYLPNLSVIRKRNRMHANNAVFEEQELQELEGTSCPVRIAKAYQSNSIHSMLVAQVLAKQDAIELSTPSGSKEKKMKKSNSLESGNHSTSNRKQLGAKPPLPKPHAGETKFHRVLCA